MFATIAILSLFAAATFAALLYIRKQQHIAESRRIDAEVASKLATEQAIAAKEAKELAQRQAERASLAEADARARFEQLAAAIEAKNDAIVIAARSELDKMRAEERAHKANEKAQKAVAQTEEQKRQAAAAALEAEKKRKVEGKKREITTELP